MENTDTDSQKTKKNEKLKKGAKKTAEKEDNESEQHSQDKKKDQAEQTEGDKASPKGKRKGKKAEKSATSAKKQKIEDQEEWIDEPFHEGTIAHYRGCVIEGESYFLNDVVQLKAPEGEESYFGRIVSLWEEPKGKGAKRTMKHMCKLQWFFRLEELPKSLKAKSNGDRHLFASDRFDDNTIGTILKKCHVKRASDIPDIQNYISHDDHYYFDKLFKEEDGTLIDV